MAAHASVEATADPELPSNNPYDVYISFRGKDTRWNFTSHLYHALSNAGICTFMDDKELWEGDGIKPGLIQAIRGSKILVVVLSRGYADSSGDEGRLIKYLVDEIEVLLKDKKHLDVARFPVGPICIPSEDSSPPQTVTDSQARDTNIGTINDEEKVTVNDFPQMVSVSIAMHICTSIVMLNASLNSSVKG